jgi:hypothetical protein
MNINNIKYLSKNIFRKNLWSFLKKANLNIFDTFTFKRDKKRPNLNEKFKEITGFKSSYFFSSARMGLYWFLINNNIGKGDKVVLQSFNCAVVPDAIIKTGAETKYLDILPDSFSPNPDLINKVIEDDSIKALVLQNSFGFHDSFNIKHLKEKRPDMLFILDSSLSFTSDQKVWDEYHSFDCIMLSFDVSKPLALITGGAILTNYINSSYEDNYNNINYLESGPRNFLLNQLRLNILLGHHDGIYQFFKFIISGTMKRLNPTSFSGFQEGTMDPNNFSSQYSYPSKMPLKMQFLLEKVLIKWDEVENVRKVFRKYILNELKSQNLEYLLPRNYILNPDRWIPLRIPLIPNTKRINSQWGTKYKIDQWWFTEPVINSFDLRFFGYHNDCDHAHAIGENIVNFPVPSKYDELEKYQIGFNEFIQRIKKSEI